MKCIEVINPMFTDDHWAKYCELLSDLRARYKSFNQDIPWQRKKEMILTSYAMDQAQHRYILAADEKIIGWLDFYMRNRNTDAEMAFVGFDGLFDHFPEEFSRAVAIRVYDDLIRHACDMAYFISSNERSSAMIREWNGRETSRIQRYQLRRDNCPIDKLRLWMSESKKQDTDLRLEFMYDIPEERISEYVALMTQLLHDMPRERDNAMPFLPSEDEVRMYAKMRRDSNKVQYTFALFDQADAMVGVSQVSISRDDPRNVFQMMTGIDRSYRGRGLSKWLKAAMILKVYEDFPENECITTDMRSVNEPIQAVNRQLGYELISQGSEFEVTREILAGYLVQKY